MLINFFCILYYLASQLYCTLASYTWTCGARGHIFHFYFELNSFVPNEFPLEWKMYKKMINGNNKC